MDLAAGQHLFTNAVESWVAVFTLLALAGSIFAASFRNTLTKKTIVSLREWSTEQDRKIEELTTENTTLKAKVSVLQDLATGKSAIEELASKFTEATVKAAERQSELLAQVGEIRQEVRDIHEDLAGKPRTTGTQPRRTAPRPRSSGGGSGTTP